MKTRLAAVWRRNLIDRLMLLYGVTMVVSATLLFIVQPMFSKMVLPFLGGAPAVWNTAMMFFQGMLLLGYGYSHLMARHFHWRHQVLVHVSLMSVAFIALPIAPMVGLLPPTSELPIPWLIGLFSVSIGLPFFVIAANAPLLQHWFSLSGHPNASDPYFLYAASNFGSVAALLAYPTVVEPLLGLDMQSHVWSGAYIVLFSLIFLSAASIHSRVSKPVPDVDEKILNIQKTPINWRRRLYWIILAFVPSSLLLGVTTEISTDVAAIPFIWVLPLSLYLFSFILVFSQWNPLKPSWMIRIQPYLVIVVAITLWGGAKSWIYYMAMHLCAFFVCAMVCHGELAKQRPDSAALTSYYFFLSLGGLLGGVFNALIAPVLFDRVIEYPIALALACAIRPAPRHSTKLDWFLDVALPVGLLLATVIPPAIFKVTVLSHGLILALPLLLLVGVILFSFRERPTRLALGVGAAVIALSIILGPENILTRERNFFGVHFVQAASSGQINILWNGTTEHGSENTDAEKWREPIAYYYRGGPFGQIFSAYESTGILRHVGIIGLGSGALACYRQSDQDWTFFEIDPMVVNLATSAGFFHYFSECAHGSRIVLGDGRLSLQGVPDKHFGLLIIDAFSSDAIPVHLITREAISLYMSKLQRDGILVLHISNRHMDLAPILAGIAHDARLSAFTNIVVPLSPEQREEGKAEARVVVIGRSEAQFDRLKAQYNWRRLNFTKDAPIWTDDYSNVLGALWRSNVWIGRVTE